MSKNGKIVLVLVAVLVTGWLIFASVSRSAAADARQPESKPSSNPVAAIMDAVKGKVGDVMGDALEAKCKNAGGTYYPAAANKQPDDVTGGQCQYPVRYKVP